MPLHCSKKAALVQLCNCVSTSNLATIKDLSDGEVFQNIITSIFKKLPPVEECENDASFSIEDSKERQLEIGKEVQLEIGKEVQLEIGKEVQLEIGKVVQLEIDKEVQLEEVSDILEKQSQECKDLEKQSDNSKELNEQSENVQINEISEKNVIETSKSPNDVNRNILQNYKFVQSFIDESYNMKSDEIVSYSACMKNNELELAKVAVFILSEVIRQFVLEENDLLKTLALLDVKIQEDLHECFHLFISEREHLSKSKVEKILCNHAKYKSGSPLKSPCVTPRRSCPSKYRKVSPSLNSSEEIYTNSPLKSFFESPVFKKQDNLVPKKDLVKTLKCLYQEEYKSDGLELQLKEAQEEIKMKDKEIKRLKDNRRTEEEYHEIIEKHEQELKEEKEKYERLKNEFSHKESNYELEISCLFTRNTILENELNNKSYISRLTDKNVEDDLLEMRQIIEKQNVKIESYRKKFQDLLYERDKLEKALKKCTCFCLRSIKKSPVKMHDSKKTVEDNSGTEENLGLILEKDKNFQDENKDAATKERLDDSLESHDMDVLEPNTVVPNDTSVQTSELWKMADSSSTEEMCIIENSPESKVEKSPKTHKYLYEDPIKDIELINSTFEHDTSHNVKIDTQNSIVSSQCEDVPSNYRNRYENKLGNFKKFFFVIFENLAYSHKFHNSDGDTLLEEINMRTSSVSLEKLNLYECLKLLKRSEEAGSDCDRKQVLKFLIAKSKSLTDSLLSLTPNGSNANFSELTKDLKFYIDISLCLTAILECLYNPPNKDSKIVFHEIENITQENVIPLQDEIRATESERYRELKDSYVALEKTHENSQKEQNEIIENLKEKLDEERKTSERSYMKYRNLKESVMAKIVKVKEYDYLRKKLKEVETVKKLTEEKLLNKVQLLKDAIRKRDVQIEILKNDILQLNSSIVTLNREVDFLRMENRDIKKEMLEREEKVFTSQDKKIKEEKDVAAQVSEKDFPPQSFYIDLKTLQTLEISEDCTMKIAESKKESTELKEECTELNEECTELNEECTELNEECTELKEESTESRRESTLPGALHSKSERYQKNVFFKKPNGRYKELQSYLDLKELSAARTLKDWRPKNSISGALHSKMGESKKYMDAKNQDVSNLQQESFYDDFSFEKPIDSTDTSEDKIKPTSALSEKCGINECPKEQPKFHYKKHGYSSYYEDLKKYTSKDHGNESILSGALSSRSGYQFVSLDEEDYLNQSSLEDIKKDAKEERCGELLRRNSILPLHLQSSYPLEMNLTFSNDKFYVKDDTKKSELQNTYNAKKRKLVEMEPEALPKQLASTPISKWKRKHKMTPNSLISFYKRKTQKRFIIPKP